MEYAMKSNNYYNQLLSEEKIPTLHEYDLLQDRKLFSGGIVLEPIVYNDLNSHERVLEIFRKLPQEKIGKKVNCFGHSIPSDHIGLLQDRRTKKFILKEPGNWRFPSFFHAYKDCISLETENYCFEETFFLFNIPNGSLGIISVFEKCIFILKPGKKIFNFQLKKKDSTYFINLKRI